MTGPGAGLVRLTAARGGLPARLLCFPHAGAAASSFAPWALLVAPDVELWSVNYPGRRDRAAERFAADLNELAAQTVRELVDGPAGPWVLFGHSMGGLVAYEVARALAAVGRTVERLVVSAAPAPGVRVARSFSGDLHERAGALLRSGDTSPVLLRTPGFLELALPVLEADLAACDAYRAPRRPATDVPLRVLGALDDPVCATRDLVPWREESTDFRGFRYFRGGHHYLGRHAADVLAEALPVRAGA